MTLFVFFGLSAVAIAAAIVALFRFSGDSWTRLSGVWRSRPRLPEQGASKQLPRLSRNLRTVPTPWGWNQPRSPRLSAVRPPRVMVASNPARQQQASSPKRPWGW
ncbi:MAG: hypothetical protein R3348_03160 [Xanthomonadales bacterium]|nr:hypothetical protein [Xanthomonadales bacterium]